MMELPQFSFLEKRSKKAASTLKLGYKKYTRRLNITASDVKIQKFNK